MNQPCDTTLAVEGMTCPSCIRHITDALQEVEGVGKVDVRLRDGIVIVAHDSDAAPVDRLIDALRDAGYESRPREV